jgi:hypothetical protein
MVTITGEKFIIIYSCVQFMIVTVHFFSSQPAISSRVIATPKELPSRQEAMAAQSTDERSKARYANMYYI